MENNQNESKQQELAQGVGIFVVLALLTLIEYFLGTHNAPTLMMWIIALVKAGLVIWFFMHIKRAFKEEGGH
jgi:caa(3)-type oxidase subunit IV